MASPDPLVYGLGVLAHRTGDLLLDLCHLDLDALPPATRDEVAGDLLTLARVVTQLHLRLRGEVRAPDGAPGH